jgi:hypothetical protein
MVVAVSEKKERKKERVTNEVRGVDETRQGLCPDWESAREVK